MGSRTGRAIVALLAIGGAVALWGEGCQKTAKPSADCTNHLQDGDETDIDCGGNTCPACNQGKRCLVAKDCLSKLCSGGTCAASTCSDGIQNGGESDVDCGGPDCAPCAAGKMCYGQNDCVSNDCDVDGGVCF
jgi:hypothetical protein